MAYDPNPLKAQIKETEEWLARELSAVRTGRAAPALLDSVRTEAYGARSPLREIANVSVEDARTLRVIPWDASLTKAIEKAIVEADLGVGTAVDGSGLRISFPELTGERRTQLAKLARERCEHARQTLRAHRADAIKEIDALKKDGMQEDQAKRDKEEVQKLIDAGNDALASLLQKKEEEIGA
ncbi:MAG: ribosome recycling factor [Patescibacteria group bacterium]|nr:ribosome recycling factor [Patescibacteria group bacterium]MDE1944574.1 ribosome recycling factor [Patescibacteria group bacterium]MDE1945426.1 ribosome recycling factor [Patescibacteria group bacterium]MDE2058002.1 ribosome recycling factor [Patescibacteria group bacterium]